MSRQEPGAVVSASVIATAVGIPPEHARKILLGLCAAGLVASARGRSGGYTMAKDVQDISVLDVADALGASVDPQALRPRECPLVSGKACRAGSGLTDLLDRVRRLYADTTLASIIGQQCGNADPFRVETVASPASRDVGTIVRMAAPIRSSR